MCFVYNLKPSNQETTFQVLKTKPAFLHSDLTTHNLRLRNHLWEEGFSLRHAYRRGQTPGLGSLAPSGKPGSVGGAGHPAAAECVQVPLWCPSSPMPCSLLSPARGHRVRRSHPSSSGNTACCGSPRNGPAGHSGLSSTLSPERRVTSFQYS